MGVFDLRTGLPWTTCSRGSCGVMCTQCISSKSFSPFFAANRKEKSNAETPLIWVRMGGGLFGAKIERASRERWTLHR